MKIKLNNVPYNRESWSYVVFSYSVSILCLHTDRHVRGSSYLIFHCCYIRVWLYYFKVRHEYFFTLPIPLLIYALTLVVESNHNLWHTTASVIQKLR